MIHGNATVFADPSFAAQSRKLVPSERRDEIDHEAGTANRGAGAPCR
jgi:hypothetical protein